MASTGQLLAEFLEPRQSFGVFFFEAFANSFCQVLRLGLSTSARTNEHQHLCALRQAVVHDAPHRMTLQALKVPGRAQCPVITFVARGLDFARFNVKIVKRSVLKRDRAPVGLNQRGIKPRGEVLRVADRGRKRNDLRIGFDVAKAGKIDFQCWTAGPIVHQVKLIRYDTAYIRHQLGAVTQQRIQLFGGAHQNVAIVDVFRFRCRIANAQAHGPAHGTSDGAQILILLHRQRLERHDVDGL